MRKRTKVPRENTVTKKKKKKKLLRRDSKIGSFWKSKFIFF